MNQDNMAQGRGRMLRIQLHPRGVAAINPANIAYATYEYNFDDLVIHVHFTGGSRLVAKKCEETEIAVGLKVAE